MDELFKSLALSNLQYHNEYELYKHGRSTEIDEAIHKFHDFLDCYMRIYFKNPVEAEKMGRYLFVELAIKLHWIDS